MIRGINIYGSTIERGMVVKLSSWSSGVPLVTICTSTDEPFGVALTDGFSNGSIKILRDGFEYFPGIIFSENDVLFVGATDGVLDNTPGPYYLKVATVTQTDEVGSTLEVRLAGDVVAIVGSAIEGIIDSTLDYNPIGPVLSRAALTGDVSASRGSNSTTLATVNSNVGTFGSSTQVPVITVNAKGLVTAVTNTAISFPSTTLAAVSAASTTSGNSLYTMTSAVPVEFRTSGGTSILYLDESNGRVGIGTNTPLGALSVYPDTDQNIYLGRALINTRVSDFAYFSHYDQTGNTEYALRHSSTGATIINSSTGQSLSLSIGNTAIQTIHSTGVVLIGTGAGLTSRLNLSDTTLAGSGSLAGGVLDMTQTWNTSGTPTAIKLNITDTASNASSLLMALQVGGSSKFKVDKNGDITVSGINGSTINSSTSSTPLTLNASGSSTGAIEIKSSSVRRFRILSSTTTTTLETSTGIAAFTIGSGTFNRVGFGGFTASDPAWKKSSAIFQARLADDSNYTDVEVLDEAYGVSWNGSNEVPTKNAVYDQMELKANIASPTFTGTLTAPTIVSTSVVRLKNYTVATLPAGTQGDVAYVTDALAPMYLMAVVGGGAAVTPVFFDGTNWVCH